MGKGTWTTLCFKSFPTTGPKVSSPGSCFFWTLLSSEPLEKGKFQSQRFTLQPQVQGLQFQQQQHIYLRFEPAGWFYLYGTDYLDLCCKAPSGESPGGGKKGRIKHKFHRESCRIKLLADNSRPLQGKRSNNKSAILT